MAHKPSLLASSGLEDLRVPLIPTRSLSTPPGPPQPAYVASNAATVSDFPSLNRPAKSRLVPYPLRLSMEQIAALDKLKSTLGIVPAELIRDAVDDALLRIAKGDR